MLESKKVGHVQAVTRVEFFRGDSSVTQWAGARETVTTALNVNSGRSPLKASEPLQLAITIGDYELCRQLVEEGENIHAGVPGCSGCTPLLYALHLGRSDIAKYLLSQGAAITGRTCQVHETHGYTTFHHAAVSGDVEFMRELLDSVQDDISQHCRPIHPIHLAVLNNNIGCVKLLLENASGKASLF